jgi:predicted GNAT family N-acyltransferase
MADLHIEPLGRQHVRSDFNCGSPVLDRYLQQQARQDADKHVAAPFVLVEAPSAAVLGYYTLSAATIDVDQIAPELAQRLPRYPQLPVTLIGRLAVHTACKGRRLGELLLMDALQRSLNHAAEIAAMAVVVQAKDEAAAAFYRRYDFAAFQADSRRLYLPMKTVARLFG